jgi:hypothetical protein
VVGGAIQLPNPESDWPAVACPHIFCDGERRRVDFSSRRPKSAAEPAARRHVRNSGAEAAIFIEADAACSLTT